MNNNSKKNTATNWMMPMGAILIVIAIISFVCFLMREEKTVTREAPSIKLSEAISCTIYNSEYPFFEYVDFLDSSTEINILFNNNKMTSMSLIYKMRLENAEKTSASLAINHASMNKSFGAILGADALNSNYSSSDTIMRMSLYVSEKDFNNNSNKYFLLDTTPVEKKDFIKAYESKNFKCTEKE